MPINSDATTGIKSDICAIINLRRYPIHKPNSREYAAIIAECREKLAVSTGSVMGLWYCLCPDRYDTAEY